MNAQADQPKLDAIDHQQSILIVDDTPINLNVIVDFLQDFGYSIRIARSGRSALERVKYDQPDLILLDVLMPGMDGFETCQQIKTHPKLRHIPIIFMTSLTSVEDKVRGFEVGAVDYVTKPLDREEVLARVQTHLSLQNKLSTLETLNEYLEARSEAEKARLFEAMNQQKEQLLALTLRLTEVQEDERKQLARELHDEMGQALTAININLMRIETELPEATLTKTRKRLKEASLLAEQTLEQVRRISLDLRPPMLDDLGLVSTLHWYVKQYAERVGIEADIRVEGLDDRLPPQVEITLYRVVQEALTNVARHAEATRVHVALAICDDGICLNVDDNGKGFDLASVLYQRQTDGGVGLFSIRERVTSLGGTLDIESEYDRGTHLSIRIPLGYASK